MRPTLGDSPSRSYRARLEEVWALWTTKEGFESWWGPQGFSSQLTKLDVRYS